MVLYGDEEIKYKKSINLKKFIQNQHKDIDNQPVNLDQVIWYNKFTQEIQGDWKKSQSYTPDKEMTDLKMLYSLGLFKSLEDDIGKSHSSNLNLE